MLSSAWVCVMVMVMMGLVGVFPTIASLASESPRENHVEWAEDGSIRARCSPSVSTAGVDGNSWLRFSEHKRIGQTFRCESPVLAVVQFGLDGPDGGYRGLTYRTAAKGGPTITVRLKRGGPSGALVAEHVYPAGEVPADLRLVVNQPSEPSQTWYVEAEVEHQNVKPEGLFLNASVHDRYAGGQLYLDGRASAGDLHLRVTGEQEVAGVRPGPFVLWGAPPEARLWMEPRRTVDWMLADNPDESLYLETARNEWVSAQLTVTPAPDQRVDEAKLSLDEFIGPNGARITSDAIRIHWLRYSHEIHHNGTLDSGRYYPDPLAPTSSAVLRDVPNSQRTNVTFWVDIHADETLPPGVYKGKAKVLVNGTHELERSICLRVRNFTLPKVTSTHTALFKIRGGSVDRHREITRDLAQYRIANGASFCIGTHGVLRENKFNETAYHVTLGEEMQHSLIATGEVHEAHGLRSLRITPWADTYRLHQTGSDEARQGIIRFWQTYYPILKERGWTEDSYTRMVDEIGGEEMDRAAEITRLFREYAPSVRIMVTAMGTSDKQQLAKAIGIADIWTPSSRYCSAAIDFYLARVEAGEEVWPYIHDYLFHRSDVAGHRLFFWALHKYGFGGATLWNIAPRGEFEHTWFGIIRRDDVWPGDGTLYYPGTEDANFQGLWRSTRFARIRDGIEDRECLLMLDALAKQVVDAGAMTSELAEQIQAVRSLPEALTYGMGNFTHERGAVQAARQSLNEMIETLMSFDTTKASNDSE